MNVFYHNNAPGATERYTILNPGHGMFIVVFYFVCRIDASFISWESEHGAGVKFGTPSR